MTMLITNGGPEAVVVELLTLLILAVMGVTEAEAVVLHFLVVLVEVDIEEEFLLANRVE